MENTRRQSGLDGLRGLAALAVFGVHVWIYQLPNTVHLERDNLGELVLFEARFAFGMLVALLVERRRARKVPRFGARASTALALGAVLVLLANGYWHASDRS